MSEQAGPDLGVPAVAGPEGTPGTAEPPSEAEVDWQKRYADLQPEYTRTTQELSELRRERELYDMLISTDDPDTRREVAQQLGYVLEESDEPQPPGEGEDPWAARDARLDRIEQALTQRQQAEQDAQRAVEVRTAVDERLDQLGLAKEDQDWVLAYAINALPATDDGMPDVGRAAQVFEERETARQKAWAKSKQAPHIAPNGQSATEVPNLDDRQQRWEYMYRRMNANEQQA
jgi:hypothetical protein